MGAAEAEGEAAPLASVTEVLKPPPADVVGTGNIIACDVGAVSGSVVEVVELAFEPPPPPHAPTPMAQARVSAASGRMDRLVT